MIIPTLLMRKLKHRKASDLPDATQLEVAKLGLDNRQLDSRVCISTLTTLKS